jgi:hypothetical protein
MLRRSTQIPVGVVLLLIAHLLLPAFTAAPVSAEVAGDLYVYHQITDLPEETGSVGFPVLSGDGTTAVFTEAPGTGDPATPNRIFTILADGSGQTEVDSYVSLCYCGSTADISNDGSTVVSTDSVQVRIAGAGGARELIALASNEISAAVITGNGQTVFFLVRRDTVTRDNALTIPRGVWAIDAGGGNLRQIIDANDIATSLGITVEETGCCFHAEGRPLDVSDDGGRVVFAAYGGTGEHFFSSDGSGGGLVQLGTTQQHAMRVAISGDGSLAAYDGTPAGASLNDVAVIPSGGGTPTVLTTMPYSGVYEPFQLTQTGSKLLVSSNGLLFDVASGASVELGVSITNVGGNHEAVLTDGLPRGTMDALGENFLYVMRTVRCADCPNQQEQLATLSIDPVDLGEAPLITDASVDPDTIGLNASSETIASATVTTAGTVLGVGFAALLDGAPDANVGSGRLLLDDGQNGDAAAGDGIYTAAAITHSSVVARENDTGPRVVRIAVEVEGADGRRHATALDIGTLTVTDAAART